MRLRLKQRGYTGMLLPMSEDFGRQSFITDFKVTGHQTKLKSIYYNIQDEQASWG